jgi:hypothetical protein
LRIETEFFSHKISKEEKSMQYAILFYEENQVFAERNHPEKSANYWGAWGSYVKALEDSGIVRGGAGLQGPETATYVSLKNGKRHVQDGPYADTKEQLGGFFVIEVPHLDAALEWAAKSPATGRGRVEIRPLLPDMNETE